MWTYVLPILALVALCAVWVLFQLWLKRLDPDSADMEIRCGGCTNQCEKKEGSKGHCKKEAQP